MSKDRKKLLHIHSSVNDKQPTPATLELGELGVNNAKGNAFISTKNSDGEVVRFSEDETIIGWMEQKEVFPYEGYVRGSDNSQVGGVTEQDLLNNKSNIIIKLNQVVPENTDYSPYDEKVNGAKDIYGNLINPISEGGYQDGAGIAIDMSQYVMQGANPSFSSVTTTCGALFQGTTEIEGLNGDCGSEFNVHVENVCIDANDILNEYGANESNFGVSCDKNYISNATTLKGEKILIDSPSGDLTVDIQACNHVSARTNDFVVRECQNNEGKVEIDTTDIDVSASTIDVKSCDSISATTDSYVLRECIDGNGKVEVDTTNINVSASTTDIKSCNGVSAETDNFVVVECADGEGNVIIDTTVVNVSADTTDIKSCDGVSAETDNFILTECSSGSGKVEINTTITNINSCNLIGIKTDKLNISECSDGEGEIEVKSCNGISAITDNFVIDSCSSGGTTTIKSCDGITLESKNITLTDGDCGSGQITIEVNDLCLVGNDKINVYGDETNVGLDCDDSNIATNTRVFGKGTLITTNSDNTKYAGQNNVEIVAAKDIKETATTNVDINAGAAITEIAPYISSDATGTTNGINYVHGDNYVQVKAGDIAGSAGNGVNIKLDKNGDLSETASNDITITASNNICDTAANNATFYGAVNTNVGINCDDTATAATTTVKGGKVIVDASATNLGLTAKQDIFESAEGNINITANDDICQAAGDSASFYGANETNIGKSCDGSISENITYWRNAEAVCDNGVVGFSSTTVDNALDEVYYRSQVNVTQTGETVGIDVPVPESGTSIVRSGSTTYTIHQDSDGCDKTFDFVVDNTIVSMSAQTYGAADEMAKKYTLWQYLGDTRVEIGEINIPKDHILKDVAIVNGHASGESFTACTAGDDTCHWYIKLVWNVFDPKTGHADDKIVYLPADDFVQDLVVNNPTNNGVCLDIWYDGQKKNISAHTEVHMIHGNNSTDTKYTITDGCKHSLTSYTLNSVSGDVKTANAATNWTYDPFDKKVTITAATDASHINRKTVSWSYGDVKNATGNTYDPGAGTVNTMSNRTMSFVIPQSIDNINRGKLTINHGDTSEEYDPATDKTMSLTHGKLKITHNGLVNAEFDTSVSTSYTMPHSSLTISYGSTCALTSSGITYNTSANRSIVVPKTISDVTGGKIKTDCTNGCTTLTGDLCVSGVVKANALYSTSDINLKENIKDISYEDYHKVSSINLKSFNFKDDETKTKTYGVIAQDLQAVGLDNIVHKDDNNNLSVDYTSLLILKIADLENTIKNLSDEIKNLKGENKK